VINDRVQRHDRVPDRPPTARGPNRPGSQLRVGRATCVPHQTDNPGT